MRVLIQFDYSGESSEFSDSIAYEYHGEKTLQEFAGMAIADFCDTYRSGTNFQVWLDDPRHRMIFDLANRRKVMTDD